MAAPSGDLVAGRRRRAATLLISALLIGLPAAAQPILTLEDISPDRSTADAADPDSASGGRVNGIAVDPNNAAVMYAATEWGGLYKSTDGGQNWSRLDGHRPVVMWDVLVNPADSNRVYATSFFDGRSPSLSGINVSTDGGETWTRPATAIPPANLCADEADQTELSAFGISIDPTDSSRIYIGTSCGLAISTDSGATWSYSGPDGDGSGEPIWDVVAAGDGFGADTCGSAGHYYRHDASGNWTSGSGLPSGRCSMAVSPYDPGNVNLFAVVGTSIYETTDGFSWTQTRTNPFAQGRIPFVATNKRSTAPEGERFDLWFGDVSMYRVTCDTEAKGPRCGTGNTPAWTPEVLVCSATTTTTCSTNSDCPQGQSCKRGGYTRAFGGHDDMGNILFDPAAANDACPLLMSSDGGVYVNTVGTSPDCHTPAWEQPMVSPHALWPWTLTGADHPDSDDEHLYFGNQDNGVFGTFDANPDEPAWTGTDCCDGFDAVASEVGSGSVIYSVCCGAPRLTTFTKANADFSGGAEIDYPPAGLPRGFQYPDVLARWGDKKYAMITNDCTVGQGGCTGADGGLFITQDIDATPIVWTELGNATEPESGPVGVCTDFPTRTCTSAADCGGTAGCVVPSPCAVYTAADSATFYVQTGDCNANGELDLMWRFTGTNPAGTWTRLTLPGGAGFGVFAVDPSHPNRLLASGHTPTDALMYISSDGGANWSSLPALNVLMRGAGTFPIKNERGTPDPAALSGYRQPSLVAFDPFDSSNLLAGGRDSGIFYSTDGGSTWAVVTDPVNSHTSGKPHIPRPKHAYFSESDNDKSIYVSSRGRGIWRLGICEADAFEPDDTVFRFINPGVTQRSLCGTGDRDLAFFNLSENSSVVIETSGPAGGDTTLTLLDGDQVEVDFDDDGGAGRYSRIERSCAADSVLTPGNHLLAVNEYEMNDTIASYSLRVEVAPCCGNGTLDPGEACDDGNRSDGDCCSATCGFAAPGSACDDGDVCTVNDTCGANFAEDFDGVTAPALPAGWGSSGTGTLWSTGSAVADTSPHSVTTDAPGVATDKVLDSPPIPVSGPAALTFRNRYDLEEGFDGAVLEIRIGGGAFQDLLAAGGNFVAGGYDGVISTCCGNPLGGRSAWTGSSGGFVTTVAELPAAATGQTVLLRWRVATDGSVAGVGQFVDTLAVSGGGSFRCLGGDPAPPVGEVETLVAIDRVNFIHTPVDGASRYDALRGAVSQLPLGTGVDEVCAIDTPQGFDDDDIPPEGQSFYYLARAADECGPGSWGSRSDGTPRETDVCP